jgi:hypothetical protein
MKRLVLAILTVVVLALPVCAQSAAGVADIPFGFVAGTTTMPAGRYEVSVLAASSVVRLVGADRYTRLLNSNPDDTLASAELPQLIFHRYGSQYFLSEFRTATRGREFPMSHMEREAQRTAGGARASHEIMLAMR